MNCEAKFKTLRALQTAKATEDMQRAPVDTLPLILSVALLLIAGCVPRLLPGDVLISPAGRRRNVVRLRCSGASIPQYGVYQHCGLHTLSFSSADSSGSSHRSIDDIMRISSAAYLVTSKI